MKQYLAIARRSYWEKRKEKSIAHDTTDFRVATHYRLAQFEGWLNNFEVELTHTGPRKIGKSFAHLGNECCDMFCDDDIEVDFAQEELVKRIVRITETCITRHGKDKKVDWDAFDSIVCAFPAAANLWRLYPERFDLEDEEHLLNVCTTMPDDIASQPQLSKSGDYYIGPLMNEDVSIAQRGGYFTINYFRGTPDEIFEEIEKMRQEDAAARIEEEWDENEKGLGESIDTDYIRNFFFESFLAFFPSDSKPKLSPADNMKAQLN